MPSTDPRRGRCGQRHLTHAVRMTQASEFTKWLGSRGVAHTSDARAAGFPPGKILAAVTAGSAQRIGRSWVAAPDCEPRKLAAAAVRGRVTCVSAAALAAVWTPDHDRVHVAVGGNASRFDATDLVVHWSPGPAPVGRNAVVDPMLNSLFHVAQCLSQKDALAVWESAIRLKKVDASVLRRVAWRNPRATALASVASALSDSHLETTFVDGLRRAGIVVRQQVRVDGHPLDGLIGEKLAMQIDGFAFHSTAADRRRDIRADARLALRGYTVLRFDFWQILFDWDYVLATVQTAISQNLHRSAA